MDGRTGCVMLVLAGLLGLGLTDCGPTPTPMPTPTPTRPAPTETPTPTPTATATPVVWQATREEYYPMAVGNYWVFKKINKYSTGETDIFTVREEVTQIGTVDDKFPAYLVMQRLTGYSEFLGGEEVDYTKGGWIQVGSEGVWLIASVSEKGLEFFSEPDSWYKFPLAIGDIFQLVTGSGTDRCEVETLETVAVPAGVFEDCLRIRCPAPLQGKDTVWLAPGIGRIKEVVVDMYTSSTEELVEYNVEP